MGWNAEFPARSGTEQTMSGKKPKKDVIGEGNYTASRNFDRAEEKFVKKHKGEIPEMGKGAERALDGKEGRDLRDAEERAKSRSHDKH
jgi:hypothetical protein